MHILFYQSFLEVLKKMEILENPAQRVSIISCTFSSPITNRVAFNLNLTFEETQSLNHLSNFNTDQKLQFHRHFEEIVEKAIRNNNDFNTTNDVKVGVQGWMLHTIC